MQTMLGNFSELESLLASAEDGFPVILWLTEKMFIAKDNTKFVSFVRYRNAKRFTDRRYCIHMTGPHDMKTIVELHVYSQSDLDAFKFLDQLGKYQDFTPCFRRLQTMSAYRRVISPCFLENVLRDAQGEIEFCSVTFKIAREGHAFATFGCNVTVVFLDCEFKSEAADAFLQGMITKSNRNVGLTGIKTFITIPFSEEMLITLLRMNLLDTYQVPLVLRNKLSSTALCAIRESQLRSLRLGRVGFNSSADMRCFLTSLRSTVSEKLTLDLYTSKNWFQLWRWPYNIALH